MAELINLTIQGIHIQTLYTEYVNKKFMVNRKYQRKLVWTIEEKRNFIDTLSRGLPIPLFLFAEVDIEGEKKLEIIDGMQRLDAIFSFIEQKYSLKEGFFDLTVMADSQALKEKGLIIQKKPILPKEFCRKIANYLLPISKSISLKETEIEETFRRINSNGKHLSNQELRQAGIISRFSNLVRQLSTEIRKDISNDVLLLNNMSKISITQRRLGFYGISVLDMFWVKNKIISSSNIRNSIDEEVIAFILADMILEKKENLTAKKLDAYYGYSSNPLAKEPIEKTTIENSVSRITEDVIKKQFRAVFSLIQEITEISKLTFINLIFQQNEGNRIRDVFHVIFMSLYQLLITDNKKVNNLNKLISSLKGIGDDLFLREQTEKIYRSDYRENIIKSVIGRIEHCFVDKEKSDPAYNDWTLEFDKILMKSQTEQNQYDFKIGLTDLKQGKFNENLAFKITKTLSAIANLGPNKVGYVIVGVADNEDDANKHKNHYNSEYVKMHHFYITGIEDEANKYYGGLDKFIHKIKETIKKAPITPKESKNTILINMFSRQYYGKEILVFKIEDINEPMWYDGKLYERHMSHNQLIENDLHSSVYQRFYKK